MKISELYSTQTVNRRVRNNDGDFHIEKQTFQVPYNPNVEVMFKRLFAKFIDIIIVFSLVVILNNLFNMGSLFLLVFVLSFIFIISVMEFLIAITPGKFIFGLRILDDNCKKLSFKFSIIKNSVLFYYFFMSLIHMEIAINKYEKWQEKKKFYVIRKKDISTVKNMTDV